MWHRSSILVTCCQAPLERSVLFRRLSRIRSVDRESCALSCGALSRAECRVCDAGSLQSSTCLLRSLVCCLGRLLNVQLCRGFVFNTKGAETGGGGCFNDRCKASLQGLFRQKASCDSILYHRLDVGLGCDECSQVCRSRDVSRSFVADSRLACAECKLHPHGAVTRSTSCFMCNAKTCSSMPSAPPCTGPSTFRTNLITEQGLPMSCSGVQAHPALDDVEKTVATERGLRSFSGCGSFALCMLTISFRNSSAFPAAAFLSRFHSKSFHLYCLQTCGCSALRRSGCESLSFHTLTVKFSGSLGLHTSGLVRSSSLRSSTSSRWLSSPVICSKLAPSSDERRPPLCPV